MSEHNPRSERQRLRIHYRGRVQGVGFRFTAASVARQFSVTGYVKNLRDGRVELAVEGPESEVDAYLSSLESHFPGHIDERGEEPLDPTEVFSGFEVRY